MTIWDRLKSTKISRKIRRTVDTILQGTHNHFFCQLPKKFGLLSGVAMKLFYSGITVTKGQTLNLKKLQKEGVVVYVTKPKSYFLYLFYYTRYKQEGLPFPQIGFDYNVIIWQPISRIFRILLASVDHILHKRTLPDPYQTEHIKQELVNGQAALLSLVEKKGFYRRFVKAKTDPIQHLINIQKSIDRPIFIVPQLMFFDKKPLRSSPNIIDMLFGTKENPGKFRRLYILFKSPGKVFVETSQPVNLKAFLEQAEHQDRSIEYQALKLRRNLLLQINRHRQSIMGPILKSREELKENILTNERLRSFMEYHSEARNIPIHRVHKKAAAYLDEIAANYNIGIIRIGEMIIRWFLKTMFEGITVNNQVLSKIKSMSQKGPLIFIPCHKSHIDYLILSYIFFTANMPCPHIAAGKNLSFWPMGPLFRSGGAFFIRRSFRGAVLYSKVFAEYIYNLLEEGFNIEFFIEGGRSRTGKLILPKLGLLSILLNAYKNGACEDMIFVPIFVGYDRVPEESAYLHEIEGKQKESENLMQVIKARKVLKKKYGRIYIQFHEPISFKDLLLQYGTPIEEMKSKEFNVLCRNLGHRIINAINNVTVVTPQALVAAAVMSCPKDRFSYDFLMFIIETYTSYLFSQGAKQADTLLLDQVRAVEHAFDSFVHQKFIERLTKDKEAPPSEAFYRVNKNKRHNLEYYKNNCIAFFVPAAITALAVLGRDAFQFSSSDLHADYKFIQYFFKYEFAYDVDKTPEFFVRKTIKAFIDDAIIMPHPSLPDTYNLTSTGFKKLKFFSNFLKTYFESYWIVLNFFMQHPQNSFNNKERLKKIESIGNRMYKHKEIKRKEALSTINYSNGINFFTTNGVRGSEDADKIKFYADAIQKHLNYV